MRLTIFTENQRWIDTLALNLIRSFIGYIPGPIQISMYRSAFFGRPFTACLEEAQRKSKHWSKSETELFAAFVASQNSCNF